ncbi:MAG: AMP-binding protein [Succinivibrio sp.]|nr:AMP-binding protein [Succinivibrio sp.]
MSGVDSPRPWLASYPADVSPDIEVRTHENLSDFFDTICDEFGPRTAFVSLEHELSYWELREAVDCLAAGLQGLGLKRGEVLALVLPNLLQYPVCVFAAQRLGLVIVNVNPLYTASEMREVLKISGAVAVVTLSSCTAAIAAIRNVTSLKHIIVTGPGDLLPKFKGLGINLYFRYIVASKGYAAIEGALDFKTVMEQGAQRTLKPTPGGYDDMALMQFTGGTTGTPKGAMLTHGNLLSNIAQTAEMYGSVLHRGQEVILTPLPLYHIFALTINLLFAFSYGCKNLLIIDPRQMDSTERLIRRHPDISIITGVNTLFNAMLNQKIFQRIKLPQLRLAVGGGAAIQSGVAERFFAATGVHILEGYGLTECSPLCCVNPHTAHVYTGSIGIPVPSTWARLVAVESGEEIWELDKPGELEIKGPQVMKGYYNNPHDNELVNHDGWLRTGDVAVWLEGGYLKIVDRLKDMILISGFNVFPAEIEDILSRYERIAECCAVGVPSDKTGEAIKLYVVRRDPRLSRAEVIAYCHRYLTGYKMPREIEFVDELPKSAVGKVLRRHLKQN